MEEKANEVEDDDNFSGSTVSDHDLSDPDDDIIIDTPIESGSGNATTPSAEATVNAPKPKPTTENKDRKLLVEEIKPNGNRIYHVTLPQFDGTPQFVFKSKNLNTLEVALLEKLRYMKETFAEKMNSPFKCQVCWQDLADHKSYMQHIVMCPVSCEECGELFPTKDQEREHYLTHKLGNNVEQAK